MCIRDRFNDGNGDNSGHARVFELPRTTCNFTINNTSTNLDLRLYTKDISTNVETLLLNNLPAGQSFSGTMEKGTLITSYTFPQNVFIQQNFVSCINPIVDIDACGGDESDINSDGFCDVATPCAMGTSTFNAYLSTDGNNVLSSNAIYMINGPLSGQLFSEHRNNIIGVSHNWVNIIDPQSGKIVQYLLNNGWYKTTYESTTLTGGSSDGLTWTTVAANDAIIGVRGIRVLILGSDGTLDVYHINTGNIIRDNHRTTFFNGPLEGDLYTSANIVGAVNGNRILVFEPNDGTFIEYSFLGVFKNDYSASSLIGGYYSGSTFSDQITKIVGVHKTKVFIQEDCMFSIPNFTNPQIENSILSTNQESFFNIYPNPLNIDKVLNIDDPFQDGQKVELSLSDAAGKIWLVKTTESSNFNQLNLSALPMGIYFLSIETQGNRKVFKIINPN